MSGNGGGLLTTTTQNTFDDFVHFQETEPPTFNESTEENENDDIVVGGDEQIASIVEEMVVATEANESHVPDQCPHNSGVVEEDTKILKPERMFTRHNRSSIGARSLDANLESGRHASTSDTDDSEELQSLTELCNAWVLKIPTLNRFFTKEGLCVAFPSQDELEKSAATLQAAKEAEESEKARMEEFAKQKEIEKKEEENWRRRQIMDAAEKMSLPNVDWLIEDLWSVHNLLSQNLHATEKDFLLAKRIVSILSKWTTCFVAIPIGFARHRLKHFPWTGITRAVLTCSEEFLKWQQLIPSSAPFDTDENTQVLLLESAMAVVTNPSSVSGQLLETAYSVRNNIFPHWVQSTPYAAEQFFSVDGSSNASSPNFIRKWLISVRWLFLTYFQTHNSQQQNLKNAPKVSASGKRGKSGGAATNSSETISIWVTELNMNYGQLLQTVCNGLQNMIQTINDQTLYLLHLPADCQVVDKFAAMTMLSRGEMFLQQHWLNISLEESRTLINSHDSHRHLHGFDIDQLRKYIDTLSYDMLRDDDEVETANSDAIFNGDNELVRRYSQLGISSAVSMPSLMHLENLLHTDQAVEGIKVLLMIVRHMRIVVGNNLEISAAPGSLFSDHFQRGFCGLVAKITVLVQNIGKLPTNSLQLKLDELLELLQVAQRMFLAVHVAVSDRGEHSGLVAMTTMLWNLFVILCRISVGVMKIQVSNSHYQTLAETGIQPLAQRFVFEILEFCVDADSSSTSFSESTRRAMGYLAECFVLFSYWEASAKQVQLFGDEECVALSTVLLTKIYPMIVQATNASKRSFSEDIHMIVFLSGICLSLATKATLVLPAEDRFTIANFLDELMLENLTPSRFILFAMDGLQEVSFECIVKGSNIAVAHFQDACVILTHSYSALYDFPIGGLNYLRANQEQRSVSIDMVAKMYYLLKSCGNMRSFTKSDLREAQQWLITQEVIKLQVIGKGSFRNALHKLFNTKKMLVSETPALMYEEIAESANLFLSSITPSTQSSSSNLEFANLFADMLEVNAITSDIIREPDDVLSSLKEAYPYLAYLETHAVMDGKLIAFVQYAFEHLSYSPFALDTWVVLQQRVQACLYSLSDFLFQNMDVVRSKPILDKFYAQLCTRAQIHGQEEDFIQDCLWKLDPECWVNEVIPSVEAMYKHMMADEQQDEFTTWLETSMIRDIWQYHVISIRSSSNTSRAAATSGGATLSMEESPLALQFFVKAMLLTDLLKRMCEVMIDKIYFVVRKLLSSSINDEASSSSTVSIRSDRKYFSFFESNAVHRILVAKDWMGSKLSIGRKRREFIAEVIPLLETENFLDESLFAMIMTAKYQWKSRHDLRNPLLIESKIENVLQLLARVQRLIYDDVQQNNYGKAPKINATYYVASLRIKIALYYLDAVHDSTSILSSSAHEILKQAIFTIRNENAGYGNGEIVAVLDVPLEQVSVCGCQSASVASSAWELFASSIKVLLECRRRDAFHFRTHYRLSDGLYKLVEQINRKGGEFVPKCIRDYLFSIGGWSTITLDKSLSELHKLFEKKRSQIVAMWSTDNPVQPWDVLVARISEFDSLRRKYSKRYLQLVRNCDEVDMAWQLLQQTLSKVSYPAVHEMLLDSAQSYLELLTKQVENQITLVNELDVCSHSNNDLTCIDSSEDILELKQLLSVKTEEMDNLQRRMKEFMPFLEPCYQLYQGLQKRKTQIIFLLDDIEHLIRMILQVLAPVSSMHEQVLSTILAIQGKIELLLVAKRTEDDAPATASLTESEMNVATQAATYSTDHIVEPTVQMSLSIPDITLSVPSLSQSQSQLPSGLNSAHSGIVRSSSVGAFSPVTSATSFPTISKFYYQQSWDSKELISSIGIMLSKSSTTTSTTAGNKRARSQQHVVEDAGDDAPNPSAKQAKRSTSQSQLNSQLSISSNVVEEVDLQCQDSGMNIDEEVML
jgi:hypothetical protein